MKMRASTARALSVVAFALLAAIILCRPVQLLARDPGTPAAQISRQVYRYGQFDLPLERGPVSPIVPRGDITGTYTVYDTQLTQSDFIAAGDLENDGLNDIISSSYPDGAIAILHQSPQTHSLQLAAVWDVTQGGSTGGVRDVYIEDMNGDGRMDIVAFDVLNGLVAIFLQTNQNGVFSRLQVDVGFMYNRGSVGDLNNDGRQDLIWTNDDKVDVAYQTNVGFAPPVIYSAPLPPTRIIQQSTVADVSGDGLGDLIAVDGYSQSMFIWESPTLQLRTFSAPGNLPSNVAVGDLDEDGIEDIAVPGMGTDKVAVTWGGDLTTTLLTGAGNTVDAAIGDVDGDAKSELVVTDRQSSQVMIWKLAGRYPALRMVNGHPIPGAVVISDLNGDGLEDIAYGFAGIPGSHAPVTVHYQMLPPVKRYLPFIQLSP